MTRGVRALVGRTPALLLAACILFPPAAALAEGPVVLQVPLIPFPGTEPWVSPLVERIFTSKLRALESISLVGEEERAGILEELAKQPEIGIEQLSRATEVVGADYALAGQFMYDDETFNLDIRVFSGGEEKQIASYQKPVPATAVFDALADAALAIATALGVDVSETAAAAVRRHPTTSFEAYRLFLGARGDDTAGIVETLEEALRLDPDYFDATLRLGLSLYKMGNPKAALPYMEQAARLGPDLPEVHNNLAVLYADLGLKEDALKEFKRAIDLKPDYREAKLNYGRLLEENGRFDQAEKIYGDLLEDDPDNVKVRTSLALLYERTGRIELAIDEFRFLSRRNPELAEMYFVERGQSARKAKEYVNAEQYFLRAVDINPQYSLAYAELGTNSYLAGEYEKSMEYFRQALALEPQNAEFHHYLGMALERSGRREEATASFERSAELGGPLETRVGLARVYLESGEVSRAIDELNLVLDENPGDDEAKELLSRAMDRAETDQKRAEKRAEFATHRLDRLESIIEDLTVTNRDLENRVLALQTDRQNMEMELEQLRAYRSQKEEQFGERMDKAIKSIEQLSGNEEIDRLRQEYTSQVRGLEEELAEARRAAETAEILKLPENGDVVAELLKERERANSLEGKVGILESELAMSEAKAQGFKVAVETMKEKDDGERSEFARLQERLASQRQDREEKTREISRLAERNSAFSARVRKMEKDLAKAQKEAAKLQSETQSWKENKGSREREFASLREQISSLQSEKKSLEREISSTKERSGSLSGDKARMEEDLLRVRAELEEARRSAEELQSRLVAVERESFQRIEEARSQAAGEVSSRDENLSALRGQLADLQAEKESLERDSLDREEELRRLREEAQSRAAAAEALAQQEAGRSRQLGETLARVRLDLAEQALGLGRYHMRNRSWDKARAAFEKVLEIDGGNGEAYYSLGEIYFQLGRFDLSKEMYQKAKEIF